MSIVAVGKVVGVRPIVSSEIIFAKFTNSTNSTVIEIVGDIPQD